MCGPPLANPPFFLHTATFDPAAGAGKRCGAVECAAGAAAAGDESVGGGDAPPRRCALAAAAGPAPGVAPQLAVRICDFKKKHRRARETFSESHTTHLLGELPLAAAAGRAPGLAQQPGDGWLWRQCMDTPAARQPNSVHAPLMVLVCCACCLCVDWSSHFWLRGGFVRAPQAEHDAAVDGAVGGCRAVHGRHAAGARRARLPPGAAGVSVRRRRAGGGHAGRGDADGGAADSGVRLAALWAIMYS